MQDVHVHVQRELTQVDSPMSTVGDVAMGLEVTFLNSAVDSVGEHCPRHTSREEYAYCQCPCSQACLILSPAMLVMFLHGLACLSAILSMQLCSARSVVVCCSRSTVR